MSAKSSACYVQSTLAQRSIENCCWRCCCCSRIKISAPSLDPPCSTSRDGPATSEKAILDSLEATSLPLNVATPPASRVSGHNFVQPCSGSLESSCSEAVALRRLSVFLQPMLHIMATRCLAMQSTSTKERSYTAMQLCIHSATSAHSGFL